MEPTPLRITFLRLLFCALALTLGAARADEARFSVEQYNQRLDRARAMLDAVEKELVESKLTDASLRQLRERLRPLPQELDDTIERLSPRLTAIGARLQELGSKATTPEPPAAAAPAPAPEAPKPPAAAKPAEVKTPPRRPQDLKGAASAPPAPPATSAPPAVDAAASAAAASVTAETAEQRKSFEEIDATLKRARAMLIETRQMLVGIVARQRALFAKMVFLRTHGLFSPALWREVASETPPVVRASSDFLAERAHNFADRVQNGRMAQFIASILAILAAIPPALYLARRVLAREAAKTPPSHYKKAMGAGWAALVLASVPVAVVAALNIALDGFDLVDASFDPLLHRLLEAVARVAVTYGFARAVFAPSHPQWRLVDVGDALALRLQRMAVAIAFVQSATRIVEQIEETVQAALPVVVATRGLGAMVVAALILWAALASARRDNTQDAQTHALAGRDWLALARLASYFLVAVIVIACASGYVTFANFFIQQLGWLAGVGVVLYIVLGLVSGGFTAALESTTPLGRMLMSGLGARREQLSQLSVLLTGFATLMCYGVAALVALAPFGVESDDFAASLQSAFFAFKIGDVTISVSNVLTALLLFIVALAAAHGLRRWLDTRYLPLTRLDMGLRNSISTSVGYLGFILAASIGLAHIGLGFEKLAIVAGALSVGIGFGLQSIVGNFVSGLILLWERAIRVGDWVVIGDEQGYVKRINVRSTEIETFDRATMIVPNSNLVAGIVKNWLRGDKVGRIKVALAPHAGVDPEKIRDILIATARSQDGVLRIPAPQVMFLGMEANMFRFELWCYVEDVEQATRVRSDLHFDLHKRLADAGVTIAAAAASPPPTIVQFPGLEKLAAAAAVAGVALDAGIGKDEAEKPDAEKKDARASDKPAQGENA
jgi:potassium efflux system protein